MIRLSDAGTSVTYLLGNYSWTACAKHLRNGFNIDVFCNGIRIATRDRALPTGGGGNRTVILLADTLDCVVEGRSMPGLTYVKPDYDNT
jgi:hypothetical protein